MALTCPACTKPHQTGAVCQRCGCDLTLLHRVWSAAQRALDQALAHLTRRQWQEALSAAEESWELCHTAEAAQCAFLVAGALGDTDAALLWHGRASQSADGGQRPTPV